MKLLLDTNICIAFLNGSDEGVRDNLLRLTPDAICICSVVKGELLYGARKSQQVVRNLQKLEEFFKAVASLPFDDGAADHYGVLRSYLEREGRVIGANDMLIAAIALSTGCTLVTRNASEFSRIVGLQVQSW